MNDATPNFNGMDTTPNTMSKDTQTKQKETLKAIRVAGKRLSVLPFLKNDPIRNEFAVRIMEDARRAHRLLPYYIATKRL